MKKTSKNDFRHSRRKLRPEDFAVGPKEEPPPSDLIDKDTWTGITSLPDDVSLRTSDHYGSLLKNYWDLWDEWICMSGALQKAAKNQTSPIDHAALNAIDELQGSIYNALVGFYRLAFSSLRNVLEHMTIGLNLTLAGDQKTFSAWLRGDCELRFRWAADNAPQNPPISKLEHYLMNCLGDNLFRQKTQNLSGGFARRLFSELSDFTHGGPASTNVALWQGSNGPIFVPQAFEKWAGTFAKTYTLGVLEAKLAQPTVTTLAFGSKLSIRDLFEQAVKMVPTGENGVTIFKEVLNLKSLW